jgi:hypothetical protein
MMRPKRMLAIACAIGGCGGGPKVVSGEAGHPVACDRFIKELVSAVYGPCAGFGQASLPGVIEGPPVGGGNLDLHDVGVERARYVKIIDRGAEPCSGNSDHLRTNGFRPRRHRDRQCTRSLSPRGLTPARFGSPAARRGQMNAKGRSEGRYGSKCRLLRVPRTQCCPHGLRRSDE